MTESIKVVHIMPHIHTGGAEHQLYELITHSDPSQVGHEVLYYSHSKDYECFKLYDQGGVRYDRIPRNKYRPVRFVREFAAEIRRRRPDIVHCWLESGNFWGRLAAIASGVKPIIIAWRNCSIFRLNGMRVCETLTTKRVKHLANSRACAEYIAKKLWISPSRFTIVYNGLDAAKFNLPDNRNTVFSSLNIPPDQKIVSTIGRLAKQKNYPMLIHTAKKAKEKGLPLHFVIAGGGDLSEELNALSRQLQVDDIVHFVGVRNDVPALLTSSDIFLFTTNFEGFPNALLQAMAARLPVVTTDFAGADELICNGQNGILIAKEDVDAAASALENYLNDPKTAKEYGNNARALVETSFSNERMVKETENLYRKLLSE